MSRVQSHNHTLIPNNSGAADGRAKCLPSALITRGRGTDYAATRRAGRRLALHSSGDLPTAKTWLEDSSLTRGWRQRDMDALRHVTKGSHPEWNVLF